MVQNLEEVTNTEERIAIRWADTSETYAVSWYEEEAGKGTATPFEQQNGAEYRLLRPECNTCYVFEVQCINECGDPGLPV